MQIGHPMTGRSCAIITPKRIVLLENGRFPLWPRSCSFPKGERGETVVCDSPILDSPGASPNRVILLTAPGRAAIATLRLEGPHVWAALQTVLRRRSGETFLPKPEPRPILARLMVSPHSFEEVVVHVIDERTAEIHCHGNPLLVEHIVEALSSMGFTQEGWKDWVERTEKDPIRAAARIALAEATTYSAAQILLDQYGGALTRAVKSAMTVIRDGDFSAAVAVIDELLHWRKLGCHLTQPWKVALVGPPNAGKSSLLNWLVGYNRAIVHPTPGTTRDFVTATTSVEGWPVELFDTAGLRHPADEIEREAIDRTLKTADEADLVVLIFDRSVPWGSDNQALVRRWPQALIVLNKRDLPAAPGEWPEGLVVSTRIPEDRDLLLRVIAQRLIPEQPVAGTAVPFTLQQVSLLEQAREALRDGDETRAVQILGKLVGEGSDP